MQIIKDIATVRTASLGRKAVDRVVRLAHGPDLAAECERGVRVLETTVSVNVADDDLNRGVVLGSDKAVYNNPQFR